MKQLLILLLIPPLLIFNCTDKEEKIPYNLNEDFYNFLSKYKIPDSHARDQTQANEFHVVFMNDNQLNIMKFQGTLEPFIFKELLFHIKDDIGSNIVPGENNTTTLFNPIFYHLRASYYKDPISALHVKLSMDWYSAAPAVKEFIYFVKEDKIISKHQWIITNTHWFNILFKEYENGYWAGVNKYDKEDWNFKDELKDYIFFDFKGAKTKELQSKLHPLDGILEMISQNEVCILHIPEEEVSAQEIKIDFYNFDKAKTDKTIVFDYKTENSNVKNATYAIKENVLTLNYDLVSADQHIVKKTHRIDLKTKDILD